MGRLFLIEFDHTDPSVRFYLCRICRTHIANHQDFQFGELPLPHEGPSVDVFKKAVNVQVDDSAQHRMLGTRTVADIYCNQCSNRLGWKFVEVPEESVLIKKDYVQLLSAKLLFWSGHQIIDQEAIVIE